MPAVLDGLTWYYGAEEAAQATAGEYKTYDIARVTEIDIRLADLTQVEQVITRDVFPKGKVLWKVEVITEEVALTGVAIDVGFIGRESSPTVNDPDGILAAFPLASMSTLGETTIFMEDTSIPVASASFGGVITGNVVGVIGDVPLNITASATTSTFFTAGRIKLRLHWYHSNFRE